MTKRGKLLPARRQRDQSRGEESILLRSAESIGRVIGSLQRQLDGARNRLSVMADGEGNGGPHTRTNVKPKSKAKTTPRAKSARSVAATKRSPKSATKRSAPSGVTRDTRVRKSR